MESWASLSSMTIVTLNRKSEFWVVAYQLFWPSLHLTTHQRSASSTQFRCRIHYRTIRLTPSQWCPLLLRRARKPAMQQTFNTSPNVCVWCCAKVHIMTVIRIKSAVVRGHILPLPSRHLRFVHSRNWVDMDNQNNAAVALLHRQLSLHSVSDVQWSLHSWQKSTDKVFHTPLLSIFEFAEAHKLQHHIHRLCMV